MEKIWWSNIDNIAKVLEPLWWTKISNSHMRWERPDWQRMDIDFSATSSEPKLIMLYILKSIYDLWYEDGYDIA